VINYEIERELKKEIFKKSFYQFFIWAFNILEPQTKLEDTFHIRFVCDILQAEIERIIRREVKGKDIIINIPPRTSKSKIVSQALLAWVWINAPYLKMIAVSYDDKLSLANAQYCKDIIKSAEYQELFSDIYQIRRDIDSKEQFANNKGGVRLSVTTGSNITGFGAEIIILDDPQNPKTAESEVERENTIKYYKDTLYNRLTPLNLGVRIIVQQRLHYDDLTGHIIDPKNNLIQDYRHICLPVEVSSDISPKELINYYIDGLLDPVRLGRSELEKLKRQGSRFYAGQYMQIPTPDEGGIIKKIWLEIVNPVTLQRDTINEPIHFFVDSAYTEKSENDPTAILACFKRMNCLYVVDVIEKWLAFPDLIKFILEYTNRFQISNNSKIFIEPKASGLSIIQQLRTVSNLNVIEAPNPDKDKITRAHGITAQLEALKCKLVAGSYTDHFINHLAAFPNGKHDDMLDTLVMAVNELLIKDQPDFFFI
jgi:predicted phage terminase large subunit-like protein